MVVRQCGEAVLLKATMISKNQYLYIIPRSNGGYILCETDLIGALSANFKDKVRK